MADRNRSNKRTIIELDLEEILVNIEPEEPKASKRSVGTASSSTASGKKALTIPQLRMLSGKSPMAVEESKNRIQAGTPDHQPTVDIGEETDAAAATIEAISDSSSTVIEQVVASTADSDGEDADATGAVTSLTIDPTHAEAGTAELNTAPASTIATNDRDIIDTTMSTERHPAQNSAVTVVGDNESPGVSVSNSTASSRNSESSEGGLIRHAPTFIDPDDYGHPANTADSATGAETFLTIDPVHAIRPYLTFGYFQVGFDFTFTFIL